MIVYGDLARTLEPRPALLALARALEGVAALPAGPGRHGRLASAFVDACALVQALVDAEWEARGGVDARSPLGDALSAALAGLARALLASWDAGFAGPTPDANAWRAIAALAPAAPVRAKLAEGFAFYALYPEAHALAARAAGLGPDATVVGLRSIGAGLAAMAAAGAGAAPPVTVRPTGHPFDRGLRLAPALAAEFGRAPGPVAVADEGPGLSGSSFLAAARALEQAGIGRERLVLLPGHDHGPGGEGSDAARALWDGARRSVVEFDAFALADPARGLARWVEDLTGAPLRPLEDLSGGAWRARLYAQEADWPAVDTFGERRKHLLDGEAGRFRLKFAGLGGEAHAKLARAQALAGAGLSPPALGLRHGFLVEPWLEGAQPLSREASDLSRAAARVGDHLAFRARALPATEDDGASLEALAEMAANNAGEALGPAASDPVRRLWDMALARPPGPRVWTDNRLHAHEWLRLPDGRLFKTDAVDHARAHDLIGAQEIAWDVAGAAAELALAPEAEAALARRLDVDPVRLPAFEAAYLAFQLGARAMAAQAHAGAPAEQARLARERDRYARRLAERLAPG